MKKFRHLSGKSASALPFLHRDIIVIAADLVYASTTQDKKDALASGHRLLVVWPGEYKTDVFEIAGDDPVRNYLRKEYCK